MAAAGVADPLMRTSGSIDDDDAVGPAAMRREVQSDRAVALGDELVARRIEGGGAGPGVDLGGDAADAPFGESSDSFQPIAWGRSGRSRRAGRSS